MTRRFALLIPAAAATLLVACGSPPTQQEAELNATGSHPEVLADSATDQAAPGANQAGAQEPGGPVSDQGSAQGDTTGSR
ncbi:MAG TPA: hypothetical protein VNH53_10010 [Sphingomicrobium sp.]|jgi:hypothetical protein|nr:hypothetical protein [Sphingomicrobium sp.]